MAQARMLKAESESVRSTTITPRQPVEAGDANPTHPPAGSSPHTVHPNQHDDNAPTWPPKNDPRSPAPNPNPHPTRTTGSPHYAASHAPPYGQHQPHQPHDTTHETPYPRAPYSTGRHPHDGTPVHPHHPQYHVARQIEAPKSSRRVVHHFAGSAGFKGVGLGDVVGVSPHD